MTTTETKSHSEEQALAQIEGIEELVNAYHNAETEEEREDALQNIYQDPLEVTGKVWENSRDEDGYIKEYTILLCTGGPAVRITGFISNNFHKLKDIKLEHQDWFTPWQPYPINKKQKEILEDYVSFFVVD